MILPHVDRPLLETRQGHAAWGYVTQGTEGMKLNTRARYSLRMMMAMAKLSTRNERIHLADVSRHCNISRRYLDQLVTPLKNAQLVHGVPGRSGGYALARRADQIKLGEIIEAAIGPISVVECATTPASCASAEFCSCRGLYDVINRTIVRVLNEYSLADILDRTWGKKVQDELSKLT